VCTGTLVDNGICCWWDEWRACSKVILIALTVVFFDKCRAI
jgi:hypothetical protein